jgi:tRNA-dihydrouridine synthase
MKIYLAPMEGLTGWIFRNAYHKYYGNIDKYFTPFVSHITLTNRELQDILPEHNEGMNVVPQILTNRAADFINLTKKFAELGYKEVNLNLGCPSGTGVKKKRGAGMLADLPALEAFLTEIYEKSPIPVSIKTRIGIETPEEWPFIQEIYNKFPVSELIVHPRVQKDMYKKPVRPSVFADAVSGVSKNIPVCCSGDIFTPEGFQRFYKAFPDTYAVMLGRGVLRNPELTAAVRNQADTAQCDSPSDVPEFLAVEGEYLPVSDRERFRKFHAMLLDGYRSVMDGDRNVLFKMKEFWFYAGQSFPYAKKELKTIKKTQNMNEYKAAVSAVLRG